MSTLVPPFEIGTAAGETEGIPHHIGPARLREALRGNDPVVTAVAAMRVVGRSNLPDRIALLADVLRNTELAPDARRLAVLWLGQANARESEALLLGALEDRAPRIQVAAAKGLGWIAGPGAYEPLVGVMRNAQVAVRARFEWAARLIAHRHGLAARELPSLQVGEEVDFAGERRPVHIVPARPERVRECLASVARRGVRLRLEPGLSHEVHCGHHESMLLLTTEAAHAPAALVGRRSIGGVVAAFIPEEQHFSIALVALVEPGGRMVVCRSTGEPMCAGPLRVERQRVSFSLRARARPGAFPLIVEGIAAPAQLAIREAVAGVVVVPKREPRPLRIASP